MTERKRGRAGVEQRRRRLRLFPICAECEKRGLVKATVIIDHIVPLAFGGKDVDANCQGLCAMCSAIKTAAENASAGGASNHPEWLKLSACPCFIVTGPPCSGKTTYVEEKAEPRDTVIDLDSIMRRLDPDYRHWTGTLDPALLNRAIRVRNSMLGALASQRNNRAFFIVAAPSQGERAWWQRKLGGSIVLLNPGIDVCKRRAIERGTPRAGLGVVQWFQQSRLTWSLPPSRLARVGAGDDGYPIG